MTFLALFLLLVLGLSLVASLYRWYKGPNVSDRILLFDLATSIACGVLVLMSILFEQEVILDIALLLAVISFVSTIGLAFWLERGNDI